jgi:hypothetical protein
MDAALNIWFNCAPLVGHFQTSSFLYPSDGAAWTLVIKEDCARTLGLRGAEAQMGNQHNQQFTVQADCNVPRNEHPLNTSHVTQSRNDKCVLEIYSHLCTSHSNLADSKSVMSWLFRATKRCWQRYIKTTLIRATAKGISVGGRGYGMTTCGCRTLRLAMAIVSPGESFQLRRSSLLWACNGFSSSKSSG